jgi:hypothetical protein
MLSVAQGIDGFCLVDVQAIRSASMQSFVQNRG